MESIGKYLSIPLCFLLVLVGIIIASQSNLHPSVSFLLSALWVISSASITALNILFSLIINPVHIEHFYSSVFSMLFSHLSVLVMTSLFVFSEFPQTKGDWIRNFSALFSSCFGIYFGLFRYFFPKKPEGESSVLFNADLLRIGIISTIGIFLCVPMIVIQTLSLFEYPSPVTLASLWMNWTFLVAVFFDFILQYFIERKKTHVEVELNDEARYFRMNEEEEGTPEEDERRFVDLLCLFISPLFYLSLLPQTLSLVGIPFVLFCFRRFRILQKKESRKEEHEEDLLNMNWIERRGIFLMPLNLVSFVFLMFLILPPITMTCGLFWIVDHTRRNK